MPSLRHSLQLGPVYLAMQYLLFLWLNAPSLGRAAPIVRNGRDVFDRGNFQPRALQGTHRSFSSDPGPLDPHFHPAQSQCHGLSGRIVCGQLRGIGRALSRPLNPTLPVDDHEMTLPSRSVSVTMVLLKLALTWATPLASTRLLRRLPLLGGKRLLLCLITRSACGYQYRAWGLCAFWHWCASVAPAPATRAASATRDSTQYPSIA